MHTGTVLKELRAQHKLTQAELAEKLFITRQAVSRWETGKTLPNTEALKLISKTFQISINRLLGSPRQLMCQCCGMPLNEDEAISREPNQAYNEDFCRWCYTDGEFKYKQKTDLLDFLVEHMANADFPPEQVRAYFSDKLAHLNYWQQS